MSEQLDKWLNNADWRKGYDNGRKDAYRAPVYGENRHRAPLANDEYRAKKGEDWVQGYVTGYDEVRSWR